MHVAKLSFEAKSPGTKVEITWWDKTQMYPAARAALAAGTGFPDVMYYAGETDEFVKAGWMTDSPRGSTGRT